MARTFTTNFPAIRRLEKASLGDVDLLAEDRGRRTFRTLVVGCVLEAALAIYFVVAGVHGAAVLLGGMSVVAAGLAFYLRRRRFHRALGHLALAVFFVGVCLGLAMYGGYFRPATAWLYLIPLAAGALTGPRGTFGWTLVTIIALAVFWFAEVTGVHVPIDLPSGSRDAAGLIMRLAAVFAIGVLVTLFGHAHARAHELASESNRRLRKNARRLRLMALYDGLTGLPNRHTFERVLERAFARHGDSVAMLFLDLDGFSELNNDGQELGDLVLRTVGERLQEAVLAGRELPEPEELDQVGAGPLVARWGGDEFAVLLVGADARNPSRFAELLSAVVQRPIITKSGEMLRVSASIGVAAGTAQDPTGLVSHTDAALRRAKRRSTGGSGIGFFDPDEFAEERHRQMLRAGLEAAVERGEVHLVYQPLFGVDGTLAGAEALIRWQSPVLGVVRPDRLIAVAEESGQILPIGRWILQTACEQAASWALPIRVSVNVSPLQLRDPGFVSDVRSALKRANLPASRLELEITEGVLVDDLERAKKALARLEEIGVGVALDDFGTGYSSLAYLRQLRFERLKIDRSFVMGMEQDEVLVRTIIAMGKNLGMMVLAEGVETHEQRNALHRLGCDELQGYLLGKPQDAVAMAAIVEHEVRRAARRGRSDRSQYKGTMKLVYPKPRADEEAG